MRSLDMIVADICITLVLLFSKALEGILGTSGKKDLFELR